MDSAVFTRKLSSAYQLCYKVIPVLQEVFTLRIVLRTVNFVDCLFLVVTLKVVSVGHVINFDPREFVTLHTGLFTARKLN